MTEPNSKYDFEEDLKLGKKVILAKEMKIGDIGKVDDDMYRGDIVIRTYEGLVSLSNVQRVWSREVPLEVRLLEPGSAIALTVKEHE